jgi:hypothetical protein
MVPCALGNREPTVLAHVFETPTSIVPGWRDPSSGPGHPRPSPEEAESGEAPVRRGAVWRVDRAGGLAMESKIISRSIYAFVTANFFGLCCSFIPETKLQ